MKIETQADLKKLIKLCRETGIDAFEIGDIKFNLGPAPKKLGKTIDVASDFPEAQLKVPKFTPIENDEVKQDVIKTDDLTDEQRLFYSARDAMLETKEG